LIAVLIAVVFVLPENLSEQAGPPGGEVDVVTDIGNDRVSTTTTDSATNRTSVFIDPEVRKRVKGSADAPTRTLEGDDEITFSENRADYSGLDAEGHARFATEATLGQLLSALEVLKSRGVERWAVQEYRAALKLYADGDRAYLEKDFAYAEECYLGALTVLEPLYERIEPTFREAYEGAVAAFEAGDRLEALRLFELAVAITPSHAGAQAGYERAKNLEAVLRLVEQGLKYERDLELEAAQRSFEQAVALDNQWQPAHDGIRRVAEARTKIEFDTRMTEGFDAIAMGDLLGARAAFRVAKQLLPNSSEPDDGLLQVEQGLRLQEITTLEREAKTLERDEHWDAVVRTYEEILKVDSTLSFANEGLARARQMSALHARLDKLIADPDQLSKPSVMQSATKLVVDITTRPNIGARLASQRDELSRLLKRAATPLSIPLVSDNATEVFVYKVGRLGKFMRKEISLRPGTYVVVGSRPGYRDVRLEFRVAPEIDMQPVIIQCEELI
jgi:tetratricopeptide (TPR) repeat protein